MYQRLFPFLPGGIRIDEPQSAASVNMKDPFEVLRRKEQELVQVRKEVDALRIVAQLLGEEINRKRTDLKEATGTN